MDKKDTLISLLVGEVVALFLLFMVKVLDKQVAYLWVAVFILPIVFFLGLYVASLIGRKVAAVYQFARFVLVGFLNTVIDFGVLNLLIYITGFSTGIYYSVFKACSASFSIVNSFFWNKLWTFGKCEAATSSQEAPRFLLVTLIGAAINIGVASLVVNVIGAPAGFDPKVWANLGAVVAIFFGFLWNFLGYKFFAFKS